MSGIFDAVVVEMTLQRYRALSTLSVSLSVYTGTLAVWVCGKELHVLFAYITHCQGLVENAVFSGYPD